MNHSILKKELKRKAIHLSSLWIPLAYLHFNFTQMLWLLLSLTSLMIAFDLNRVKHNSVGEIIKQCLIALKLNNIFRSHEDTTLCGASYMLLAALLCLLIFPQEVFITAFLVLMISDTIAAFCGLLIGKRKIYHNKTLEGALGFLFSSLIISAVTCNIYSLPLTAAIVACIASTGAEVYAKKTLLDDNFLIPVAYGVVFIAIQQLAL